MSEPGRVKAREIAEQRTLRYLLAKGQARRYRYCTNGWCPYARHEGNGQLFLARPERTPKDINLYPQRGGGGHAD